MIAFLSSLTFMQPLLLVALFGLPVLWYILRVTPPAPKRVFFPATRFLMELHADEQAASKTPWWILLLRLLIVGLIIVALARPVINPSSELPGKGAVRVLIDNGWAAAQTWDQQIKAAKEIITQAGRERREIYITPTTIAEGEQTHIQYGPISAGEAISIIRGLEPQSWPADYEKLAQYLQEKKERKSIQTVWLSHGLNEGYMHKLVQVTQRQGALYITSPSSAQLPLLLRPSKKTRKSKDTSTGTVRISVDAPPSLAAGTPVSVQALTDNGNIVDIQTATLTPDTLPTPLSFDIIESLQSKIHSFRISGKKGAGSVFLLDDQFKKKNIGIAAPAQKEATAPLIEASYYIKRALEPTATITTDTLDKLIKENMSVIILPDVAGMPTQTLNNLEEWVENGGVLIRFAGPNIAQARQEPFLLPVKLRSGGRSLSGSLSWDEPQTIASFDENSPFYGLDIPDEIFIKQQVLADPEQDLENKVWARLTDGTPFITAQPFDKGLSVLFHTTANTSWSDFALSGLYVSILNRTVKLSGQASHTIETSYTALDPIMVLDGYGALVTPAPSVKPISLSGLSTIIPSSEHPPGIYGRGDFSYALNLGATLSPLQMITGLPSSIAHSHYEEEYEVDIMPMILYTALLLFCIDWIVMIMITGKGFGISLPRGKRTANVIITLILLNFLPSQATASDEWDLKYTEGLFLAYIITGDQSVDAISQRGLEKLAQTLTQRTSVEPAGVVGLYPAKDTLSFFPLIYWPVSGDQRDFSNKALSNIQHYLDHGGTILFDTRDRSNANTAMHNTANAQALHAITSSLNIPPVSPIPDNHVLGRSFYLLDTYPGLYDTGTLWVEQHSAQGRDNVSSVLIGSNNWAAAWAQAQGGGKYNFRPGSNTNKGNARNETSLRFGVNLMMYALTGNYKADQVHIPHILKRLGE
ncbi:MAG: DUF4159 domain-containing protein [Alphaproteobacteria bacterium]